MSYDVTIRNGVQELGIFEKNNDAWVSSRTLSDMFEKRHDHVIRDIQKMSSKVEIKKELCYYKDKKGQMRKYYKIEPSSAKIIENKYKLNTHCVKDEYKFKEMLETIFTRTEILYQYKIGDYRVDFYFPDMGIIVEYDEEHHLRQLEKDKERENAILEIMKHNIVTGYDYTVESNENLERVDKEEITKILRIKKGDELNGLRELCILITELRMSPCSDFM